MSRARAAWVALVVVAGAIAALAIARWAWAVTLGGPVLYGEGAVAHAALLSRDGLQYTTGAAVLDATLRPIFTAANYPPLYFRVAGLGDPFVVGRIASIASTLFVAAAIAWRARAQGALVAIAVAAAWLATVPVVVWGAAVKPDLVALALTVAGVVSLSSSHRRPLVAGILLAAAVWAKPTAALPALALAIWCVRADRAMAVRYLAGGIAGLVGASVLLMGPTWPVVGGKAFRLHVIDWNALPWDPAQAGLLALVAVVTVSGLGIPLLARLTRGPAAAYAVGAIAVMLLGGREGATINYLLDLSAAAALVLADALPRIRERAEFPAGLAVQLLIAIALFDPFGVVPGRGGGTGAWGDPSRVDVVRTLPTGPALVEDSGLLIAAGSEPIADDLFLWSRIYAVANDGGGSFDEGPRLVTAVRERRFASVVSEVDLERVDRAPAYERARWHPYLVSAVLDGYVLDRKAGALWVYRPR